MADVDVDTLPSEAPDDVQEPLDTVDELTEPVDAEPVGAEAVAEETTDAETTGLTLSSGLIDRAKQYDLSASDLEGLDDVRAERLFSAMDRRIMQPQQPEVAPAATQPAAARGASASGDYAPLKIDFGDDLDESVVKPFQTVVDHVNRTMQKAHDFRRQARQEMQAMNLLREFADFDRFVTGLGEDWAPTYGTGATVDMDRESAEFKARMSVFHGAKSLVGDAAQRRQRLNVPDAQLRSHRGVHLDRIVEHERNKLDGKVEKKRKGSGERVAKGKAPAMSPHDEAVAIMGRR